MVLGNMDWPRQNVKYWRYTGKPKAAPLDGRWYFIMGDSDLGFGANAPVDAGLFVQVKDAHVPVSRLLLAMLRDERLKQRFIAITRSLIDGPLRPERCVTVLDSLITRMDPEMGRHTARWRKPMDKAHWLDEVAIVRDYAQHRAAAVRKELNVMAKERH
ncbi:MAG TPA: CotH kinase family protein, partial [Flavobacteriales bacterium]|nr:CotH kinase family protein [Flavobacteriales bacterium]